MMMACDNDAVVSMIVRKLLMLLPSWLRWVVVLLMA